MNLDPQYAWSEVEIEFTQHAVPCIAFYSPFLDVKTDIEFNTQINEIEKFSKFLNYLFLV